MRVNTNTWNKIRYTFYAPLYDGIVGFAHYSRKTSIQNLNFKKKSKVLIVGAGTGLDLNYLPKDCSIVATDITPSMVERIRKRNAHLKLDVVAKVMDGQNLRFENESFDVVILHLIVAVIPDAVACIKEAERVLMPGGEIALYDKFVKDSGNISLARKLLNPIANLLFSTINRSADDLIAKTQLQKVSDQDADFNGLFRLIQLKKRMDEG